MNLKHFDKRVIIGAGIAASAVAAAGAVAVGSRVVRAVQAGLGAGVKTIKLSDGSKARVLKSGGVYQSATYAGDRWAEPVFEYYRGFDAMFDAEPEMLNTQAHGIDRVLMLGGGGFAYPKHALMQREGLSMHVVEVDPKVIQTARRKFYLDKLEEEVGERLTVITADARVYLEQTAADEAADRYDVIVNDCFDGSKPVRSVATVQALKLAKACLNKGGLYLANIVSANEGADVSYLRDATATAKKVFKHAWVLQTSDEELGGEDNYLLIASDAKYAFADAVPFDRTFVGKPLKDKRRLLGRSRR